MSSNLSRLCEDSTQKSVGLFFLYHPEMLHGVTTSNSIVEQAAVEAEPVTRRDKNKRILPSNEFAAHLQNGTFGSNGALFLQKVNSGLVGVKDNDRLAETSDRANVA
jgi:hypothetical protein